MAIFSVIEDNSGGLHLYVFATANREICIFARDGYETSPGQLSRDIAALQAGVDPISNWGGCDEDSLAAWNTWTWEGRQSGEWTIIADENGPVPSEQMGITGRREFYSEAST